MAEAAILAALKILGEALASEVVKRPFSQSCIAGSSNLEASMNNISRELQVMQEYIDHTDVHDQSNSDQVAWINGVRKLANGIEDNVAELVYLVGNKKYGSKSFYVKMFFRDPKSLFALKRVALQLEEAEKSIKHFADLKERWVPTTTDARINRNANLSNENSHYIITASAHFIDEDNIVGIEEHRAKLTNWLNSEKQRLSIISVWGMGGIGKTTLVTNVFKRESKHFDCNAWVTISHSYSVEGILRNLIFEICKDGQTSSGNTTNMDIRDLKDCVNNLLKDKKFLIVLDDMWDPRAFQDIADVLVDNHIGSRIMITSRNLQVVFLAPESNRLELKPLLEKESWDLFCRKAFHLERNHECPSNLKMWAKEIVAKCDGLPLALVSLGNMLSLTENTEAEWKRIHDQLTWELENNPNLDRLKNILSLSFKYLPRHLKNCFLYCSLFPEDFHLARKKLVRLWMAEGFIEEKGKSTLEEVAEGYLNELVYRNMLQVVRRNSFGRVKWCRMHDILRELAISLSIKENFGKLHDDSKPLHVNTSARRISIDQHIKNDVIKDGVRLPQLRTFMVFHPFPLEYPWLSMIFDKSRYIRVLNLECLGIEMIPNAIGDLFNLHYLGLRKTMIKVLPNSIKKLHNLQTLDLYSSQIQYLPNGIVQLKNLRHLFAEVEIDYADRSLQSHTGINLSKGVFDLKHLQTIQAVESNIMVVKELRKLTQLRSLRICNVKECHSAELCKSLSKLSFLSHLSIFASPENELLQLDGLELPQIEKLELIGTLKHQILESPLFQFYGESIRAIFLFFSRLQNDPLPLLSHCRNITELHLHRAYEGEKLTFQTGWFPKLKTLALRQMPNLFEVELKQDTMISLEQIYLCDLKQLVDVPKGIEQLVTLKWVYCFDMLDGFGGLAEGTHQQFHFTCQFF